MTTGASASPGLTARTLAPIWGLLPGAEYVTVGSSVPSTASSTMQPASASPLPMLRRPGPRGCASLRHRR